MEQKESSSTGIIIGILVIVVIAIVAWIAYTQGIFSGKEEVENTNDSTTLEINVGGDTDSTPQAQ